MNLLFILPIIALSINFNNDDNSFFSNLKKTAKEIKSAMKDVAKETGEAFKEIKSAMKEVAKETGEAFKEIGSAMKDVAKETGESFKDITSSVKDSAQSRDRTYREYKQSINTDSNGIDSQPITSTTGKSMTKLSHFNKLDVKSVLTVIISQGNEESILIEGPESVIQYVEAKVIFNTLYISSKLILDLRLAMDFAKLRIYVTCVDLSKIECTGSSTIKGNSVISVNNIGISVSGVSKLSLNLIASNVNVDVSGSSDVKLSLQSNSVKTVISGVSEIKLNGKTASLDLDVSGSSNVEANMDSNSVNVDVSSVSTVKLSGMTDGLKAKISGSSELAAYSLTARNADVKINGVSKAKITVTDSLGYEVTGYSDLKYKGNPKIYKAIKDEL